MQKISKALLMRTIAGPLTLLSLLLLSSQVAFCEPYKELNKSNPGQRFELRDYLTRNATTAVVFYSEHSAPSLTLLQTLESMSETDSELAVNYINLDRRGTKDVDWNSPLARQHRINILPHVLIYEDGKLVRQGHPARKYILQRMDRLEKRRRRR